MGNESVEFGSIRRRRSLISAQGSSIARTLGHNFQMRSTLKGLNGCANLSGFNDLVESDKLILDSTTYRTREGPHDATTNLRGRLSLSLQFSEG